MGYPSPDNSPVFWEIQKADGTWFSLHTYAWSVKSFGGRRFFAGAKRGEDLQLPHRRGRIYVPKTREAQTYDINMWVFPTNADGSRDVSKTVEQKSHENWRKIVDAVDQEGQFRIRKRWYPDNAVKENFRTDVVSAIGMAEFIDGSGPDSDDGRGFYGNLTFQLADPYFYGRQIVSGYTATNKYAEAITLTNGAQTTISVQGDAKTDHLWLFINNPGTSNPKITFPDGNWIQLVGAVQTGTVIVDCRNGFTVLKGSAASESINYLNGDASGTVYNGKIRRNPYFQNWPTLDPMDPSRNKITVAGSGTIKLLYDPAYR